MSFLTILSAAEGGAHVTNELIMPSILFGAVALVAFAALAIVTWTFRDVANRHADKAEAFRREHADSQH
ncbi:hypothetical protein GCM10022198_05040 [Klugiella xanthotipulae]|uniref:4-hydroxybenzoate polyprenyltransferase n=1 Tax=Klugiella xanthotipulae TaxID=244735 RepID=A0A543HSB9_9MICO|nr:hypothetical protein [Klugiella xanthotipulae]TQM61241.1 hypothetical protein FB466_2182 [Klugiella xanthotipulae]